MQIDVEHVARLARLGLSEEEKKLFTKQLASILDFAASLNKVDTDNVPPTTYAMAMKNVFREDVVFPDKKTDEIILNAPDEEIHMFRVPRIIE